MRDIRDEIYDERDKRLRYFKTHLFANLPMKQDEEKQEDDTLFLEDEDEEDVTTPVKKKQRQVY